MNGWMDRWIDRRMTKDCMAEQILYPLGGPRVSLLPPSPLLFLIPSPDDGFQGPSFDGNDPSLSSAATLGTGLFTAFPPFASRSLPTATPISMSVIASPYLSYWCLLLGFAGVSPPPSGPHGRPNAWLCSPARREGWDLIAELQRRKCPGGKGSSQKGREISRRRVQGRDGALGCLGSGSSRT